MKRRGFIGAALACIPFAAALKSEEPTTSSAEDLGKLKLSPQEPLEAPKLPRSKVEPLNTLTPKDIEDIAAAVWNTKYPIHEPVPGTIGQFIIKED